MSAAFRLGLGRFGVAAGVSISGIPHAFPGSGGKPTQELEGISSSKDDLGSYSSGFLTSLHRINEELIFEAQLMRIRVLVFFFVFLVPKQPKTEPVR
jgi:hypothetical protein